jgi:acyl carrier protein
MEVGLGEAAIRERLREFICEAFLLGDEEHLDDATSLLQSGILDSTGVLELVIHLEQTYEMRIADEEIIPENLDSIDRLCGFVRSKLAV